MKVIIDDINAISDNDNIIDYWYYLSAISDTYQASQ